MPKSKSDTETVLSRLIKKNNLDDIAHNRKRRGNLSTAFRAD